MADSLRTLALVAALLGSASSGLANASAPQASTYVNGQVVSVDPARRLIVVRNGAGPARSYVFDDLLAGTGDIRAGDPVILALVGGAGRQRVASISRLPAPQATARARAQATPSGAAVSDVAAVRARFADQVASLSLSARSVDSMWSAFVSACDVKPVANEGGGRDWFGLWDGRVQADYSGGSCRDLFNQIISAGEGVKKGMAAAETSVRNVLTPGAIREIRTLHAMNWDGWTLPSPPRRDP